MNSFKAISFENFSPIAHAVGEFNLKICDFTPYVILAWQKYYNSAFAKIGDYIVIRHTVDGEFCYSPITDDITRAVSVLLQDSESVNLSLISEEQAELIKKQFSISHLECSDSWADYIYRHSDITDLAGKRYSGQRNHINKFTSLYPDWSYEEIGEHNLAEVSAFYKKLSDTAVLSDTASYEQIWLTDYLNGLYHKLPTLGGLVRANGEIVSFAFGEVIKDTLYVHVEKARRDIQGAYQMIVREFARHNSAELINREEDMGIEGLRTSKLSYHPIKLEKKYKMRVLK